MKISNQEALSLLKNHKKFEIFLNSLNFKRYPGLDLEKVFYFVSSGVLVNKMPLDSTFRLMKDIKIWLTIHSRGGARKNAGRPSKDIKRINLSAESKDLTQAKKIAKRKKTSLQAMFRIWLKELCRSL